MPRYKLTVAYDGTNFHGWQKQNRAEIDQSEEFVSLDDSINPDQSVRTVQSALEDAVRHVVREPVQVVGASRTDAGVHARGQVAAFTTTRDIPVEKLPRAVTSRLPDDVQVLKAEIVPDDFDPIRGAIAKGYCYRLAHSCASSGGGSRGRGRRPLFDRHVVAHTAYKLDPVRMNAAARLLMGEHDFTSFTRLNHGRENTVRTVFDCKVTADGPRRCRIEVAGSGFLYNMVRIIAGTLVEVGRGAMEPESMPQIIEAKDRRAAGPTLPPEGLCLMWIYYPQVPANTGS